MPQPQPTTININIEGVQYDSRHVKDYEQQLSEAQLGFSRGEARTNHLPDATGRAIKFVDAFCSTRWQPVDKVTENRLMGLMMDVIGQRLARKRLEFCQN